MSELIEEYMDVLQNIEFALVGVYDKNPTLTDTGTMYAVETLIKVYTGESRGREVALPQFKPEEREAYDTAKRMCDWRLGRSSMEDEKGKKAEDVEPLTLEVIIACLKRLLKSINTWYKRGGRRGYYEFVKQFIK
ncbi:MAG TPA: hypothetical protein VJ810_21855 [Blastocatellia bacterium]|nr:hypothetical protein [Blastocatellia bacterium]